MKAITKEKEWPKFLKVNNNVKNIFWNKHLLKPWKIGEIVKVMPFNEQIPSTNITVEQFRKQFVKIIRKDDKGQWNLKYTWGWEIFELLTRK